MSGFVLINDRTAWDINTSRFVDLMEQLQSMVPASSPELKALVGSTLKSGNDLDLRQLKAIHFTVLVHLLLALIESERAIAEKKYSDSPSQPKQVMSHLSELAEKLTADSRYCHPRKA